MSDLVRLDTDGSYASAGGPTAPGMGDPSVDDRSFPSARSGSMKPTAVSARPSFFRRSLRWVVALALLGALAVVVWPSFDLLGHHDDPVGAAAVGELEGRPVAVSAGSGPDDTTLRVWDLTTGDPIGEPIVAHPEGVVAMALGKVDGRPVAVTGGYDNTVRIWDLATRGLVGEPIRLGNTERVDALAVGEVNGRAVVVVAAGWGDSGYELPVWVWDLATHEPFGDPMIGHTDFVSTVALGEVNGRAVAVTGSVDGTIRMWDLTTREQIGDPMTNGAGVGDVALGRVDGRQIAVSSDDKDVRVWDLTTHRLIGAPMAAGHVHGVRTVVVEEINGRPVALTGGGDDENGGGAVRVWDLRTHRPLGERMRYANWVGDVAVGHVGGKAVAVTGDGDGDVRVRDLSAYAR
ncbi:WD40 repeat domain-containing protein [Streptosporangium jomthongense]|uniref:WD40 repeat domain-containing protein n=1 Tax=Streptosporangium jomthongense TaxID=1193683 RepID=A0ABV8FC45_9ACTN